MCERCVCGRVCVCVGVHMRAHAHVQGRERMSVCFYVYMFLSFAHNRDQIIINALPTAA